MVQLQFFGIFGGSHGSVDVILLKTGRLILRLQSADIRQRNPRTLPRLLLGLDLLFFFVGWAMSTVAFSVCFAGGTSTS